MPDTYLCPNCKTNKTRFHILKQDPIAVKLFPQTGEVDELYEQNDLPPIHMPYTGPETRVQCGACGLIEDEVAFIKFSQSKKNGLI